MAMGSVCPRAGDVNWIWIGCCGEEVVCCRSKKASRWKDEKGELLVEKPGVKNEAKRQTTAKGGAGAQPVTR